MVYAINAFLILIWNYAIPDNVQKKKKILCILYCLQWIIISGFRSYSVGSDTLAYKISFDSLSSTSWNSLFERFVDFLRGTDGVKDPLYDILAKSFNFISGGNYTLFLVFIACLFTIPMTVWVYKYSDDVCMSFMIYSALFYSFFAITGHRQTIASALVIFGGYECMKKNKIIPLLLLHFVAFFIHKSSICFIILYFARFIKINKPFWYVVVISTILCFIFKSRIMTLLGNIMGYEHYTEQFEGAGTYTFTLCFSIIVFATLLFYKRIEIDIDCKFAICATSLALFFIPLTYIDPSAMRVVQYFSIFIMLLVPKIISSFKTKDRIIINLACFLFLLVYIVFRTGNYLFVFWG